MTVYIYDELTINTTKPVRYNVCLPVYLRTYVSFLICLSVQACKNTFKKVSDWFYYEMEGAVHMRVPTIWKHSIIKLFCAF